MASFSLKRLAGSAGLQTIAPQLIGIALFFALSKYLSKEQFGLMGWCTAAAYILSVLGSFGLEQIVFRRLAADRGQNDWAARAFWQHNFFVSLVLLALLLLLALLFPGPETRLLPWFFAAQAFLSLATPIRLLLNARLRYAGYARATIAANLVKLLTVYALHRMQVLTLPVSAAVLLPGNALEDLLARLLFRNPEKGTVRHRAYRLLLREALPQYLAVIFDVCLARLDWILLGLLATPAAVAEYSFAYRAYELEKLPTAMLSTLLLPLVARWWHGNRFSTGGFSQPGFPDLLLVVPALLGGAALLAGLLWKPLVGGVLKSGFGEASFLPLVLLNLSIVFQFAINQLWVQAFAARRYQLITRITAFTALLNLVCNLVLIPRYGASGAAVSILVSGSFQFLAYSLGVKKLGVPVPLFALVLTFLLQAACSLVLLSASVPLWAQVAVVIMGYPAMLWAMGILRPQRIKNLLSIRKPA